MVWILVDPNPDEMMMSKRRLPVLVEHSVGQVETLRVDAARRFNAALQDEAERVKLRVTCTPGCASCCYHPVSISVLEAVPIYRYLVRQGRWDATLRKRLEESGRKQLGMAFEVWLFSLLPCPLLHENKCTAYEERPFVCRTSVSVGDPYYCHPHQLGENTRMIPRDGALAEYHAAQAAILRRHKQQVTTMPIGLAVVLAERLCTGSLELKHVDHEVLKEFENHG